MLRRDVMDQPPAASPTVDPAEIARFTAMAEEWWNPNGRFRAVHAFNPVRCDYIIDQVCAHYGRDRSDTACLKDLTILDIGCGAGVVCEPVARAGATVTGIDATHRNIEIARWHAAQSNLEITYQHWLAEHAIDEGREFDVVLNTEVVEHVTDPSLLMAQCAALVKPGGILIVGTVNRTVRSFVKAIIGAEYVLRLLPRGTHEWRRFVSPKEIENMLGQHAVNVVDVTGLSVNPLTMTWRKSRDTSVNYMLSGVIHN